ncbi:uncharacterized protein LOC109727650 [Ananas comosus]|uniref:Uncharacterized protein LOC109727650 n=1 Tax=Ananas comosus TaxID=4615 RepID=A0A6P5GZZ9_ANACO|nr:uncharacterized protein LOC109727650 [Ananas comosus]
MVPGFKRSISLPMSPRRKAPEKPYGHARSASLPCPSHPLVSHLEDAIRTVRRWTSEPDRTPVRISTGLGRIGLLLAALDELLRLPQAEDALRRAADRLLDDLLLLADAYGSLRSAALALREAQSETRAALRRRDAARLASSLGSQRRAEKELARIASAVRSASRSASDTEIAGIVGEAIAAISAASVAVLLGISAISAAASAAAAATARSSSVLEPLRKLGFRSSSNNKKDTEEEKEIAALERLEELEECVGKLESGSERVFRSLVNIRVSLLNILTPSF